MIKKLCRYCKYYDKDRQSYYGDTCRCTKRHKFVNPADTCDDYTDPYVDALAQATAQICPGGCIKNYADPAPHCAECQFSKESEAKE